MARPPLYRNPLSIAGAWLTTLGAFAFLTYWVLEELGFVTNPYAGLVGFVVVPAVFVLGLLIIPLGVWRESRRRAQGGEPWQWPLVDMRQSRTRQVLGAVAVLTLVNIAIVSVAGFGAAHYMETNQFCGQVCHEPMQPEFTAHQVPPHSAVDCVQCHVGEGAAGTIRAKINGTRQLWLVMTGNYARPIPTPAHGLPVASQTCARCHTFGYPDRDMTVVRREYGSDEASTESVTTLEMLTSRIHWHARPDVVVEYVAEDPQLETIPYVRLTNPDGSVTEFMAEGTTARPEGPLRRMDCLDCHSRPAHRLASSAEAAVDRAIAAGQVSRDLPFIKREMVEALTADYADRDAAADGIRRSLSEFYLSQSQPATEVARAVDAAERLYRLNVFPAMNVSWGTYKSQLGHLEQNGCFRCHDDSHTASGDRVIRMDCDLCHNIQ